MCLLKVDFAVKPNEEGRTVPVDKTGIAYKVMLRYKDRYFFPYLTGFSFSYEGVRGLALGSTIERNSSNAMLFSGKDAYPMGLHLIDSYEEACGYAYGEVGYLASSSTIPVEQYHGQLPDRTLVIAAGSKDISDEDPADFSVDVLRAHWRGLLASGPELTLNGTDGRIPTIVVARMTLQKVMKSYGFSDTLGGVVSGV